MAKGPAEPEVRIDLVHVVQLLLEHLSPALCHAAFRRVQAPEAEEHEYLWAKMAAEPVAGHQEVHIPRNGSRAARTAQLEVRYASVTLTPPKRKTLGGVSAWAVYAREVEPPPEVESPLDWMLLTTVEVADFAQATERLRWYTRRWGIEVYHRVLKSGCRIEDRQLNSADRIESCLAIDLVVAWRIFWLVKQGRETPDVPCDTRAPSRLSSELNGRRSERLQRVRGPRQRMKVSSSRATP